MSENIPILEMKNLNIEYANDDGNKRIILEDGNFSIMPGEIVLIVGENGSGKSSILRTIIGDSESNIFLSIKSKFKSMFKKTHYKLHQSHELFFLGNKIDTLEKHDAFKTMIGYSRQEDDIDSFYERRVWNYVLDYASHAKNFLNLSSRELKARVQKIYDILDCNRYCEGKLKKMRLKNCSGGEKKIVSILSALSRSESKLFIFDEPINNLDAYHARKFNNYLVDLKKQDNPPGILIITHCPIFTSVDKIYELRKGKLILKDMTNYEVKTCFGNCNLKEGKYEEEE